MKRFSHKIAPLLLTMGLAVGIELPAMAFPRTVIPSQQHPYRRSGVVRVSPPRANYSQFEYNNNNYRDRATQFRDRREISIQNPYYGNYDNDCCNRYEEWNDCESKNRTTHRRSYRSRQVIINPPVYKTLPTGGNQVRVRVVR